MLIVDQLINLHARKRNIKELNFSSFLRKRWTYVVPCFTNKIFNETISEI